jgi:sulfatase maturation enzyme AslB (radical SAM superfamily)
VNRQKVWKPKECEECKFINICPTCVGYNWQLNRDTGARTTFHCDEFKLEVLASAKLEALRLGKMDNNDFSKYSSENTAAVFKRIEAILELL